MPPDIAVEIRSPGDNRRDVEAKVDVLVRAGTGVVIVVNPKTRTVFAQDASSRRIFSGDEAFEHPALPGFTFALPEMFDALRLRRPAERYPPDSSNSRSPASSRIGMASDSAFASLLPASSPATT